MSKPEFKLHLAGWPGCGEMLGALTDRHYQKRDRTYNVDKVTCIRCLRRMTKESQKMIAAAERHGVTSNDDSKLRVAMDSARQRSHRGR